MREEKHSHWAKRTYSSVIALVVAGIHQVLYPCRQQYRMQLIKVQHEFSLKLKLIWKVQGGKTMSGEEKKQEQAIHFHLKFMYMPLTLMDPSLSAFRPVNANC